MRDRVRFLLGGERRELAGIDPTMTVLDYLRLAERRTGTKEGCNEGDCGACTVVVGRLEEGALRYHTINACIAFVGMLDGAQLLTVEDLRSPDGGFHPAQAAMVDCHGSQCGFCTPGFVMSLFALGQEGGALDPGRIDDALAGNLCRCTGYAPIVAAAERMREIGGGDLDHLGTKAEIAQRLGSLQDEETLVLEGDDRRFFAPATVSALADLLEQHPEAVILAGGTDVGLWVTKQLKKLDPVIWIGRIAELKGIEETGDRLRIGAGVTYSEALDRLAGLYPDLGELFRRLGGLQVRNAGTIGGNIANGSPIGDSPPALIALGARLALRHGEARRELALEDFFLDYGRQDRRPGEFVEAVLLPKPTPDLRFRAYKVSKRFDQDISAVMAAFALRVEDGKVAHLRLAYGGMAAVPKRAVHAEQALIGEPWNEAGVEAAMAALEQDFQPISDMRASSRYRLTVAKNLLRRFHLETTDPATQTRLVGDPDLAHV